MSIDPQEVTKLFMHCLYKDAEISDLPAGIIPEGAVVAEGIRVTACFHPGRLEEAKPRLEAMLQQLDRNFDFGWTFLNLCMDKQGNLWTGEHKVMDELMMLSIGAGLMEYCMHRDMWSVLPGGMPYVRFRIERLDEQKETAAEEDAINE